MDQLNGHGDINLSRSQSLVKRISESPVICIVIQVTGSSTLGPDGRRDYGWRQVAAINSNHNTCIVDSDLVIRSQVLVAGLLFAFGRRFASTLS